MRYEYGAWPRWRVDKNVRYQLKGLFHVDQPSADTAAHFKRMSEYVARFATVSPHTDATRTLSIAAVGDVMWIGRDSRNSISPEVRSIIDACDVRLVNLETPIDESTPVPAFTYDRFNSSPDILDPWTASGKLTVFSICNNHGLDHGASGVSNTRSAIVKRQGAYCVGGMEEDDSIVRVSTGDCRIVATGMTFGSNRHADTVPGIPQVQLGNPNREPDWPRIQQWIDRCRRSDADLVVIIAHWGFEYEYWPETLQRQHAYRLIAMGVDLVIGSSPHVLQPVDVVSVNGFDPDCPVQLEGVGFKRQGVIAYSLGNFVTRMILPACRVSAVLELRYSWDTAGVRMLNLLRAHPTIATRRGRVCTTRTFKEFEKSTSNAERFRKHLTRSLHSLITE